MARKSGCRLQECANGRVINPPVTGRRVKQVIATDGSYIGPGMPVVDSRHHAPLLHGRVLSQYQPGLPKPEVRALDQLVKDDSDHVAGCANQTGVTAPVAGTSYLGLLTCPA